MRWTVTEGMWQPMRENGGTNERKEKERKKRGGERQADKGIKSAILNLFTFEEKMKEKRSKWQIKTEQFTE